MLTVLSHILIWLSFTYGELNEFLLLPLCFKKRILCCSSIASLWRSICFGWLLIFCPSWVLINDCHCLIKIYIVLLLDEYLWYSSFWDSKQVTWPPLILCHKDWAPSMSSIVSMRHNHSSLWSRFIYLLVWCCFFLWVNQLMLFFLEFKLKCEFIYIDQCLSHITADEAIIESLTDYSCLSPSTLGA